MTDPKESDLRALQEALDRALSQVREQQEEITNLLQKNERLYELAYYDGTTGVGSRVLYDEKLKLFQHLSDPFCLVLIDLDHFKSINDRYGHSAGDAVLARFGAILKSVSHQTDVLARVGGEEFAVLLRGSSLNEARAYVDRLLEHVREDLTVHLPDKQVIKATVSIGYAKYHKESKENKKAFYGRADKALYAAKRAGRDCAIAAPEVPPS